MKDLSIADLYALIKYCDDEENYWLPTTTLSDHKKAEYAREQIAKYSDKRAEARYELESRLTPKTI